MAHSLYAAPDVVADLERTRLVGWADAYDLPAARWLLRITGRKPDIILNALAAQHAAIRAGLGIGVLPCFLGEGLVRVETSPPPVESLWLVAHATDATAERVRLVYEEIAVLIEKSADRLTPMSLVDTLTCPEVAASALKQNRQIHEVHPNGDARSSTAKRRV